MMMIITTILSGIISFIVTVINCNVTIVMLMMMIIVIRKRW